MLFTNCIRTFIDPGHFSGPARAAEQQWWKLKVENFLDTKFGKVEFGTITDRTELDFLNIDWYE